MNPRTLKRENLNKTMLENMTQKVYCRLASTKPTIENVMPYVQYQQTQPRLKGLPLQQHNELPILYGGGRNFLFGLLPESNSDGQSSHMENADLFVLNSCVIIWISSLECGLQIPYTSIIYHGVRKIEPSCIEDGHTVEIVLTVERDYVINELFTPQPNYVATEYNFQEFTMSSVELVLRPKYANFDRHYNEEMENLFTFKAFGLNRGDTMVMNSNNAIATCMDFFYTEDSDDDEVDEQAAQQEPQALFTGISDLINNPNTYQNGGAADDLDADCGVASYAGNGDEAGMSVEFYGNVRLAGQKQGQHDEGDSTFVKKSKY